MESDGNANQDAESLEVHYEYSSQFPRILDHLNASILVTTYQAGKLLIIGVEDGELKISFLDYEQPMGLAVSPSRIAIGTRRQIHFLVPAHETQGNQSQYDGCFVPRSTLYTGNIHGHDLGWGTAGLWVVNTLFSSLCTLHEDYSFVPQWMPPFITELADQDRCHLNGMALKAGAPRFVSAMSETDTAAGWRPHKATSGVIMEVPSGQVVCRDLSMPHSPRIYDNRLWVLDSGHGALTQVDTGTGKCTPVETMPGYTRGLSFCGQFAFVGLSKIRETSVFGGVPIAENRDELRCGVGVVDMMSGHTVATFQFHSGVNEIFAVETLVGFKNPLVAGASVDQQSQEVWIVPSPNGGTPESRSRLPIFSGAQEERKPAESSGSVVAAMKESTLVEQARKIAAEGQLAQAAVMLEEAIARSATPASLLVNLGNMRQDQGDQESALLCYQRALQADENCIAALQNLGYLLFNMGEAEKARDVYQKLIEVAPSPINRLLSASVLPVVYDSQEDVEHWREVQIETLSEAVRLLEASPGEYVDATKSLVPTCFFAAYQGKRDRHLMKQRGKLVRGQSFSRTKFRSHSDGRLRVGFLSAYFRDHTIGRLNIRRLENLCRDQIHLTIIYAGSQLDEMANRFEEMSDAYVRLPRSLDHAIDSLSSLELDILVHTDVGMDSLTQTLAFSRFAPVQVATWGHPDTTGSPMIDYFLSSEKLEPDGLDSGDLSLSDYSEQLCLLPSLGIDYEMPGVFDERIGANLLNDTYGRKSYLCPQTLFKFHPDFDSLLATILEQDKSAVLVLLEGRLAEWTHRLRRRFRRTLPERGQRVRFIPAIPRPVFLSVLAAADVILDPIHFGGGNSSIEALGVGRPVVTMPGAFLRSRITSALYREVGLDELIAENAQQYCELAFRIANDKQYRDFARRQCTTAAHRWMAESTASSELEEFLLSIYPRSTAI